mmetsp:Transcript_27896/g.64793  ORF Transcript_27896/g.64793 Transcript_27896/m.64793 type:complete len:245 (+) Transcript_27896:540-1274(+)
MLRHADVRQAHGHLPLHVPRPHLGARALLQPGADVHRRPRAHGGLCREPPLSLQRVRHCRQHGCRQLIERDPDPGVRLAGGDRRDHRARHPGGRRPVDRLPPPPHPQGRALAPLWRVLRIHPAARPHHQPLHRRPAQGGVPPHRDLHPAGGAVICGRHRNIRHSRRVPLALPRPLHRRGHRCAASGAVLPPHGRVGVPHRDPGCGGDDQDPHPLAVARELCRADCRLPRAAAPPPGDLRQLWHA